jgi:hypothetical protein
VAGGGVGGGGYFISEQQQEQQETVAGGVWQANTLILCLLAWMQRPGVVTGMRDMSLRPGPDVQLC